ncbi:MAG: ribose 5-phosphate isomerase B [Candidatus Gracilibacteria bacterium]|nr:ribose 5-phosphate isomerase B [Candidatus Gracilibacteria bacterium]
MKIILGSDHGGYQLKEHLRKYLAGKETEDLGVFSEESSHYPEIAKKVAEKVVSEKCFGILICGTGIGVSIAANKVNGARAALCHSTEYAALARQHNHANILCLGGRFTEHSLAEKIVDTFLTTEEEDGRHDVRVAMLDEMDINC